jgi:hypothetical protein
VNTTKLNLLLIMAAVNIVIDLVVLVALLGAIR